MTGPSIDVALDEDVANLLLLWLAIHGGDPAQHGRENAFTVTSETYQAAIELVSRLEAEFGHTRLIERGEVADRMQERFGVSPEWVPVNRLICYQSGDIEYCFSRPLLTKSGWTPAE